MFTVTYIQDNERENEVDSVYDYIFELIEDDLKKEDGDQQLSNNYQLLQPHEQSQHTGSIR